MWLGWSSGPSCAGCTSSGASRSASCSGGRGWRATRSGAALRAERPPGYVRRVGASKLDPFKDEIQRLLREDPRLPGDPGARADRAELGFDGGKTLVYDYVRELRPLYAPRPRTFQRTVYRPRRAAAVRSVAAAARGAGRLRPDAAGWVVVAALGFSRAGAGDAGLLQAGARHPGRAVALPRAGSAALPQTLVIDREGALHAGGGRPTDAFAAFCGQLQVGWHFCEPADPQAKGVVERLQGYMETSFEPGRRVRQPARLPGPARRLVRRARQPAAAPHAARPARSTCSPRSAR